MAWYNDFKFTIHDYKCFGSDGASFGPLNRVNILVGKNNTGKSTLVDFVEALCTGGYREAAIAQATRLPWLTFETRLKDDVLRGAFSENVSGGTIRGNHWEYGKLWIDKKVKIKVEAMQNRLWEQVSLLNHDLLKH